MQPAGGTELQHSFLEKFVSKDLLDNFQICTSIPGKIPLDKNKINILWQKNSYDQPNLQEFFKNKERHKEYDWYVFNSHWNYEKFRYFFDIPTERCVVLKNGCSRHFKQIKPHTKGDSIKMIFHPTPWRGLNVMLAAMQYLKRDDITLDVYSSCQVYGSAFQEQNDKQYEGLYEQARQLPNVNYIGYKPNEYILDHLQDYKIFPYPNTWEETFCISALEALSAGLHMITTNHGALYETCSEWPVYVNYEKDHQHMAMCFASAINSTADYLHRSEVHDFLCAQQDFYSRFYHWEAIGQKWKNFLEGALRARSK